MNDNNIYTQTLSINMQKSSNTYASHECPPPKLGDLSVTENGDYPAKDDGLDGYANVGVDVASQSKTVVNLHYGYSEEYEKDIVTLDKPYEEVLALVQSGMADFHITDEYTEDDVQCAGYWIWYDQADVFFIFVATVNWNTNGLSYYFNEYPDSSGQTVCNPQF